MATESYTATDPWTGRTYTATREVPAEQPTTRVWCPECRSRVVLEEASQESTYRGEHEVAYMVERLACGHQNQREVGIVGASPGGESLAEAMADQARYRSQERNELLEGRDR